MPASGVVGHAVEELVVGVPEVCGRDFEGEGEGEGEGEYDGDFEGLGPHPP